METMTAKAWLSRTKHFDMRIAMLRERHQNYSVHWSSFIEAAEDFHVESLKKNLNFVNANIDCLLKNRLEIETAISRIVRPSVKIVLEMHYLHDFKVKEIADKKFYSKKTVERLLAEGENEIEGYLNCWKD